MAEKYRLTTDLAFDPHELRDLHGEWTKSPVGAAAALAAAKIPGGMKSRMSAENSAYPKYVQDILAKQPPVEPIKKPTLRQVSEGYQWPEMDKQGSDLTPEAKVSLREQHQAQIDGKWWSSNVTGDAPDDEQYAASTWEQYQEPTVYQDINRTLRENKQVEGGPTPAHLRKIVAKMFADGGYTTKKPMTVYRALKSSNQGDRLRSNLAEVEAAPDNPQYAARKKALETAIVAHEDWASKLKPGTTFTDDGIISTTAHNRFSQGWLALNSQGQETDRQQDNDVVMEIRVPKGTRIVGGDPQFIETMLAPGTKFKIVSSEKRKALNPYSPLGGTPIDPFDYTHVVAEVVK